jgi:hypothetical protein
VANIAIKIDHDLQAFHAIARRTSYDQTSSEESVLMPEIMRCHSFPCSRYQLQPFCIAFFLKSGQLETKFSLGETHRVICDEQREMAIL